MPQRKFCSRLASFSIPSCISVYYLFIIFIRLVFTILDKLQKLTVVAALASVIVLVYNFFKLFSIHVDLHEEIVNDKVVICILSGWMRKMLFMMHKLLDPLLDLHLLC